MMPDKDFLSQEEIDALLKAGSGDFPPGDGGQGGQGATEAAATAMVAERGTILNEEELPHPEEDAGGEITGKLSPGGMTAWEATAEQSRQDGRLPIESCEPAENLTPEERDALGEIGNISMGSAATTLSELLKQKVTITSPRVTTCTQEKFFGSFKTPCVVIQVEFKEGLKGFNVLIVQLRDAMVMADLMMGGDGANVAEQISELELSAASEAMNQMIGSASTSLSAMFRRAINISPPATKVLELVEGEMNYRLDAGDPIVVISFQMTIGDLVDTEIMQVMSLQTAKEEAAMLLENLLTQTMAPAPEQTAGGDAAAGTAAAPAPERLTPAWEETPRTTRADSPADYGPRVLATLTGEEQRKLELLLDIPLKVSVVLGRTRRPIKEVLNLTPGAIVELSALVDESVEVLVNGTLVARGEVVVVNENFGVRITSITSPEERVEQLGTRH